MNETQSSHTPFTWLDLYPPPPLWPVPHLTARIDKVKQTLSSIAWKLEIRRQIVALAENNGLYCTICSHPQIALFPDSCGASCALRRPKAGSLIAQCSARDLTWLRLAKADLSCYDKLVADMERLGYHVPRRTVVEWEVKCKNLVARTEDSELPSRSMLPVLGLNQCWNFAGRWGQGPGLKLELAPEEMELEATVRNRG